MNFKLIVLVLVIFIASISCQSNTEQNSSEQLDPNTHKVTVEEVIQTNNYTYLKVKEKDIEKWLAVSKRQVKEGEILYYADGLEMKDFKSKELNKVFASVYFIQKISNKPILETVKNEVVSPSNGKRIIPKEEISIKSVKDGITIGQLFSNKDQYSGKRIKINGKIVKFSPQIMGKNWVHLQDGTSSNNDFDLTITTTDLVKVGDVVTFEGKISLNKDFGAGYSYDLIMEEAKLVTN